MYPKRLFDILFSIGAILFFFPIGVVSALLIFLFSPGPIFYPSHRVGRHGKSICCWKFRTMCTNADKRLHTLLETSPALREEWSLYYKLKNDPRITPIGRFLRKTSLDEIPQFLNVLRGEMSVVGPRPVTAEEIETYYGERAETILSIRPGVTGLWQTSEKNLLTFNERVVLEASYVGRASFLLDLQIIFKTIRMMFFAQNNL